MRDEDYKYAPRVGLGLDDPARLEPTWAALRASGLSAALLAPIRDALRDAEKKLLERSRGA